jgi:quercetin dioxygenase-like cupin family protein
VRAATEPQRTVDQALAFGGELFQVSRIERGETRRSPTNCGFVSRANEFKESIKLAMELTPLGPLRVPTRPQLIAHVRWSSRFPKEVVLRQRLLLAALMSVMVIAGETCARSLSPQRPLEAAAPAAPSGLILQVGDGERRVRRAASSTPFILKVDQKNGGSPELVMGYEELPPGQVITPHRHLLADEIIFVHRGSGVATVGGREAPIQSGATVYIPRNVRITLRNTGTEPLAIAFFFSKPGFEDYLRDTSVLEGQTVLPLSAEERARIRARHQGHTVYEQQ